MALEDGTASVSVARTTDINGRPVIYLSGELDLSNADQLRESFQELLREPPDRLTINLSGLTFMDSSGIALLVEISQRVDQLEVDEPSPLIRRVLDATGVSEILRFAP